MSSMRHRTKKAPDNILEFYVDTSYSEPVRVPSEDRRGEFIELRPSEWTGTTVNLVVNIPKSVLEGNSDMILGTVSFIKNLMWEWEQQLKNPDVNGREPQLRRTE